MSDRAGACVLGVIAVAWLTGFAATWCRFGWRWAVGLFIGGPCVLMASACLALLVLVILADARRPIGGPR